MVALILGDQLEETPQSKPRFPPLNEEVNISSEAFALAEGYYMVDGVPVRLFSEGEKNYLTAKGLFPKTEIKAASDTSFFIPGAPVSIYLLGEENQKKQRLIANYQGGINSGPRYDPNLEAPEKLREYEGTFYSHELDTEYIFVVEDGKLIGKHQRHLDMEIIPIQPDRLRADAFHMSDIQVIRWPTNEIRGIRVSNGRVRNLWFVKVE